MLSREWIMEEEAGMGKITGELFQYGWKVMLDWTLMGAVEQVRSRQILNVLGKQDFLQIIVD